MKKQAQRRWNIPGHTARGRKDDGLSPKQKGLPLASVSPNNNHLEALAEKKKKSRLTESVFKRAWERVFP